MPKKKGGAGKPKRPLMKKLSMKKFKKATKKSAK